MKTILVTGGAGFIGSHLCKKLVEEGNQVYVLDNLLQQVHGKFPETESETFLKIKDLCTVVIGDASIRSSWDPLLGLSFDVVVCLAAETGTGQSMACAQSYCNTNIGSIALLNDLIVEGSIRVERVILGSSRSVYGDANIDKNKEPIPTKESDPVKPKSIYAITKLCQEQLLFTGFKDVDVCVLRFQNVYGPGQSLKNPYTGILSIFSVAMLSGKKIQIFEDGMMSRDFVYIDDVVDSLLLAVKGLTKNREIYNVGLGQRTTVIEVAETLKRLYSSDATIHITGEVLRGDIRHNYADITKIQKIGYVPKIYFSEGAKRFTDWVKQKNFIEYNQYENSIDVLRNAGILN
jgi:dTDP-L-rhamnose 4-epimerase